MPDRRLSCFSRIYASNYPAAARALQGEQDCEQTPSRFRHRPRKEPEKTDAFIGRIERSGSSDGGYISDLRELLSASATGHQHSAYREHCADDTGLGDGLADDVDLGVAGVAVLGGGVEVEADGGDAGGEEGEGVLG